MRCAPSVAACFGALAMMDALCAVAGLRRAVDVATGFRRGTAAPASDGDAVSAEHPEHAERAEHAEHAEHAGNAGNAGNAAGGLAGDTAARLALAAAFYPRRALCLEQSLALCWLLRRRSVPAELRIGVQPLPFQAHAWVEVGGCAINEREDVTSSFVAFDLGRA
jgi:hypothetical protein